MRIRTTSVPLDCVRESSQCFGVDFEFRHLHFGACRRFIFRSVLLALFVITQLNVAAVNNTNTSVGYCSVYSSHNMRMRIQTPVEETVAFHTTPSTLIKCNKDGISSPFSGFTAIHTAVDPGIFIVGNFTHTKVNVLCELCECCWYECKNAISVMGVCMSAHLSIALKIQYFDYRVHSFHEK